MLAAVAAPQLSKKPACSTANHELLFCKHLQCSGSCDDQGLMQVSVMLRSLSVIGHDVGLFSDDNTKKLTWVCLCASLLPAPPDVHAVNSHRGEQKQIQCLQAVPTISYSVLLLPALGDGC